MSGDVTDEVAWAMFFGTIVGMAQHPGYGRPGTDRPQLWELAEMADGMLRELRLRFPAQAHEKT